MPRSSDCFCLTFFRVLFHCLESLTLIREIEIHLNKKKKRGSGLTKRGCRGLSEMARAQWILRRVGYGLWFLLTAVPSSFSNIRGSNPFSFISSACFDLPTPFSLFPFSILLILSTFLVLSHWLPFCLSRFMLVGYSFDRYPFSPWYKPLVIVV